MSTLTATLEKPIPGRKPAAAANSLPAATLQRKCACGGTASNSDGECQQCRKKKLQRRAIDFGEVNPAPPIVDEVLESPGQPLDTATRNFMEPRFGHDFSRVRVHTDEKAAASARAVNALAYTVGGNVVFGAGNYAPGKISGRNLLAHELTHVVQQRAARNSAPQAKLEVGPSNDNLEQEADRFAEQIAGVSDAASAPPRNPRHGQLRVQRAVDDHAVSGTVTVPPGAGPIVEDEAQQLGAGQMRKTEFLEALRNHVCSVADSVLTSVGRTSQGCPMIERWIGHLRQRNVQYIERGLRKYATPGPQAGAHEYITAVGERVREGVTRWASTGDVSGVPPELMSEVAGGGFLGALGSAVASIGGAISGIGRLFAKGVDGRASAGNPAALQAQLNLGSSARPLESGVQSRMEGAFGHSFAQVRIHADSQAARMSSQLNARAFTIGRDVAFAAGEYSPGTPVGDALIAHELAHVVQQGGGAAAPVAKDETEYNSLEEDADLSAVGAMVSLWGADPKVKLAGVRSMPGLRSGLRLQRCGPSKPAQSAIGPVPISVGQKPEEPACTADQRQSLDALRPCCTASMLGEIRDDLGYAKAYVENAIAKLASPQDGRVVKALQDNFAIGPDDGNVNAILGTFRAISDKMGANAVTYICRSHAEDPLCATIDAVTHLDSGGLLDQPSITLCARYPGEKSPVPEMQAPRGAGYLQPQDHWVRVLIHEYAHVAGIHAEREFYKCKHKYPQDPAKNILNADCYAWFAADLAGKGESCS